MNVWDRLRDGLMRCLARTHRVLWPLGLSPLMIACSALVPHLVAPTVLGPPAPSPRAAAMAAVQTPAPTRPPTVTSSPTAQPSPTPTPQRLLVAEDVRSQWSTYFTALSEQDERLHIAPQGASGGIERLDAPLLTWAASPPGPDEVIIRQEPFVAVTNVRYPRMDWTRAELVAMAEGREGTLQLILGDDGTTTRQVLGIGSLSSQVLQVPDWEAAKEYVATHEGTWSLLPWHTWDFRVRAAACEGISPEAGALDFYPLTRRLILREATALPPELIQALRAALGYQPPPTVELVAVGDMMLARNVDTWMRQSSWRYPFEGDGIQALLAGADVALGNLECVLSTRGQRQGKAYTFRASPDALEGLVFAGFDALVLANNHTGDYGHEGLRDTLAHVHEVGLVTVGAGENLTAAREAKVVTSQGLRLALLAYSAIGPRWLDASDARPGSAPMVLEQMVADVKAAAAEADLVIVSCHWGIEYSAYPTAEQRRIAKALSEAGAALIIGHHPHVVQGLEYHANTFTAYSLGNFVFDMSTSERSEGVVLRCLLDANGVKMADLVPYRIERGQPQLLSDQDGAGILTRIARVTAQQGLFPGAQSAAR